MSIQKAEKKKSIVIQNNSKSISNQKIDAKDNGLLTFSINNRRYLGNKYKLDKFIKSVIDKECGEFESFADLFAGTGAVASMFQNKRLIINDILYSNYVCYQTWFGTENYSQKKLIGYLKNYNSVAANRDNYFSKNFSDTYFSAANCRRIGFIRNDIEKKYSKGELNFREKCILITSLLYAMDRIANTCGHYDAYRKNGDLDGQLVLGLPKIEKTNARNELYNEDINTLVRFIKADVVYLDPPYNSRQYCDSYHLLENVARWQRPEVSGVAKKWRRDNLRSSYCTNAATMAFEDLIESINAEYIVLSYNNMAKKGNDRSNAKLSDDDITRILSSKGRVKTFSQGYRAFSTGKSNIKENAERLFVCKCL